MSLSEYKRQLEVFEYRAVITLKCDMCDKTPSGDARYSTRLDVAEDAYWQGWRVQNGQMLCQYCTDGKR